MLANIRTTRIEWCDCDPAGIIFYPRYFEIFDTSTTVLIERALGMSKIDYLKAFAFAGHPLVEARARFRLPTRFGDEIAVETALVECGRSSFKLEHRLSKVGGALAVEGYETRVWVVRDPEDPKRMKSQPIPPEVLARFNRNRAERGCMPPAAGPRAKSRLANQGEKRPCVSTHILTSFRRNSSKNSMK